MTKKIRKVIKEQRGSLTIEFIAMFPFIIFAFMLFWQIALVGFTLVVTEAAARDGARVAAVGGAYETAVKNAISGLQLEDIDKNGSSDEVTVTVSTKVPVVKIPLISDLHFTITRDATMPRETKG
ncbi:TadE/TadG family type IV pilus assembly protein [Brevibacillus migulae]|uniref:TadE/TadG family type IV pilus assembly protein n=1 Tax=Brevibacillus migulae TaxID=1644114 RepID=UPI00106E5AEC|nr:TadE family protein [Brevibacillus migulae]